MTKKKTIILTVAVIAVIAWGVRVYFVNQGVAKAYDIKTYQVGDSIPFDGATFKVTGMSAGKTTKDHGYESFPLTLKIELHNTSDKDLFMLKVIEAKLAYGMDFYQTREGDFDPGQLRNLPPDTTAKITLIFHVEPKQKGKHSKLYIDQTLYGKQVMDKYKKGKRYGIAVKL